MKKQTLTISFMVLILCSCQKEVPNTYTSPEADVYVAGFVSGDANYPYPSFNPFINQNDHPTYWKNGSPVQLEYGDLRAQTDYKSGRANAIAVSGNNVYVAGYGTYLSYRTGQLPYGVLWKNGVSVNRDSMNILDTYELYSLIVSNNDIYMVGWGTTPDAGYSKNENRIALSSSYNPTNLNTLATATSITLSGNDVYVSGAQQQQLSLAGGWSNVIAEYWKNGNQVKLTDGSKDTYTTSIAVSGTDVYVAGSDIARIPGRGIEGVAKYWKNGILVNLTDGATAAEANAITVSGNDVYIAGTQWDGNTIQYNDGYIDYRRNPIAKYWKNGKPVNLTDGSKWAEARSIAVSGSDVYVAGFEGSVAKYWKNGNPVILGDVSKNSEAYCILLVKK